MKSSRLRTSWVALCLLAGGLAACSPKPDGARILGRWQAERVQLQGMALPMGPDFVVSRDQISSLDGSIRIPVAGIEERGNEITLDTPGPNLSFEFDSEHADRMSFKIPLLDRVYFHRVKTSSPAT